jgi:hypothetical protein
VSTEEEVFPVFEYHLDESDPDMVVLRRQDDTFVAAFSARGVTPEASSKRLRKTTVNSSAFAGHGKWRNPSTTRALDPDAGLIHPTS